MARINLLPWREEQRQRKNKEFITLVAMVALLAAAVAGATLFFFSNQLTEQQQANQLITQENQRLDGVLKEIEELEQRRADIISRMKVIQDLQGRRPVPVRVWDDMAKAIPEALYLTQMNRDGEQIVLIGKADNPNIVSTFITNLNASNWMKDSRVRNIKKDPEKMPTTGKDGKQNVVYPEDNYVEFEITTEIETTVEKTEDDTASKDAGGKK